MLHYEIESKGNYLLTKMILYCYYWQSKKKHEVESGLLHSVLGKCPCSCDSSNIDVNIMWTQISLFVKKSQLSRCWSFSWKLDWGSYIVYIFKTDSKKIGALSHSINFFFFFLMLCFIPINLPLILATKLFSCVGWCTYSYDICWISYKIRCVRLLRLHLLLF